MCLFLSVCRQLHAKLAEGFKVFLQMREGHRARTRATFWSGKQGNAIWWSCIIYRNQLCRHPPCCCAFCATHTHTQKWSMFRWRGGKEGMDEWGGGRKSMFIFFYCLISPFPAYVCLKGHFYFTSRLFLAACKACWSSETCWIKNRLIVSRNRWPFFDHVSKVASFNVHHLHVNSKHCRLGFVTMNISVRQVKTDACFFMKWMTIRKVTTSNVGFHLQTSRQCQCFNSQITIFTLLLAWALFGLHKLQRKNGS